MLRRPEPVSWSDRWRARRDRLVASRAFQRLATAFPLTRPIARARGRALFDLCAGFVYSQVLLASVRLRLFEVLAEGPRSVPDLAERLALPVESARLLLRAAAALGLAERRGEERFGLGLHGAALLANPGLGRMIEHHATLYDDLRDPVALLRGETRPGLARAWPYAGAGRPAEIGAAETEGYTGLMAATQPLIADEILAAYPFRRHRRLLDIGGGDGSFLSAVAGRAPRLDLMLFDLPPVAERARARFAREGLAGRAAVFSGDFLADALPKGADVATLVRIVHDHDDGAALAILSRAREALAPGGVLVLAEPFAETGGAEPVGDAYFGFYLFAMGSGRPRSAGALAALLGEAGFRDIRRRRTRTPFLTGLLTAVA